MHEARQFTVGQCWVMFHRLHLSALGQQIVEVTAPAARVLTLPLATRSGGIQHALDAPSQTRSRFRLGAPQGFNDPQDKVGIDSGDRNVADDWVSIGRKGVAPLLTVLGVAPAVLVRAD